MQNSAAQIVSSGISAEMAIAAGGDGSFWVTKKKEFAERFAGVCPQADVAEPVVLEIHFHAKTLEILEASETEVVLENFELESLEFLPDCFSILNEAIVKTETLTLTE